MQLELLNEQGQAAGKVEVPDTVFARDYNEALVHQVVVAGQAQHQEAVPPEGHGQRPRRYDLLAVVARRRSDLPEPPGRELHPEAEQEDVPRRYGVHPLAAGA